MVYAELVNELEKAYKELQARSMQEGIKSDKCAERGNARLADYRNGKSDAYGSAAAVLGVLLSEVR